MRIDEYIDQLCDILSISKPNIIFDSCIFATNTQIAACDPQGTEIVLKSREMNPDNCFAIAHELRHCYQIKMDKDFYFGKYKTNAETDFRTYNKQPAEIDANAFAMIIMERFFRLTPQFNGIDDDILDMIDDRADVLEYEMYG